MPFDIKDERAEWLACEVVRLTGETLTQAVVGALEERLSRLQAVEGSRSLADELDTIALRCAALPVLDNQTPADILNYDEYGLPH